MTRAKIDRIVVHAGLPKTGTTAIQHALLANVETLASRGVAVPLKAAFVSRAMNGVESIDHGNLLTLHGSNEVLSNVSIRRLYETRADAPRGDALLREVDSLIASKQFDSLVLSAEQLADASQPTLDRIALQLRRRSRRIDVCLYVRRPDRAYVAHASQAVKDGGNWLPPSRFRLGVRATALRLESAFGSGSVSVFRYGDLKGGWDVVEDFSRRVLGVSLTGERINASLSLEAMSLLRSYSRSADTRLKHFRDRFELLVPWLEVNDRRYSRRTRPILRSECVASVMDTNKRELDWLRARGISFAHNPPGTSAAPAPRTGLGRVFANTPSVGQNADYLEWVIDGLLEACVVMNEELSKFGRSD